MESWKQYAVSVIGCCLICGIISKIPADTKRKGLLHLICGMALGIALLGPLAGIRPEALLETVWPHHSPEQYIAQGKETAQQIRSEYIKAACEAYILDKAESLGADIRVQIMLSDILTPVSATLTGNGSTNIQGHLQQILMTDLGIPKENQTWIWSQENNSS